MRKIIYGSIGLLSTSLSYVNANLASDQKKPDPGIVGNPEPLDVAGQGLIGKAMGFLYIIAVIYALWGGFMIMTAGGSEEKVKKGRTIIIQALIGLVVIWLANSIVGFVVTNILGGGSGN